MAARRAAAPSPDPGAEAPTFEGSLGRLAEIVESLEQGDLPLEQSLRLFEEGVRLARATQASLDAAERRVEELLAVGQDGEPVVRDLPVPPEEE